MIQIKKSEYTNRYLARIILEATTPLAVGSGEKDITTDAIVTTDANGLPYIPGTSLAGVLRNAQDGELSKQFFGYQTPGKKKDGKGSEIIFSEARLIGKDGKVIDGLQDLNFNDPFYKHFKVLPIRQHVRITSGGVAADTGKFDQQVVFKGSRFCFEIEMVAKKEETSWLDFEKLLAELGKDTFRLGGGTRKGFGEMKICSCQTTRLDLTNSEDLEDYLNKSSDLSHAWTRYTDFTIKPQQVWHNYTLQLKPDNFFLFGSGFGNDQADITPVKATYIAWENKRPSFQYNHILIPATSVKGALAHRVAYHYNLLKGYFANSQQAAVGSENEAVRLLFGNDDIHEPERGNILFSDIIAKPVQGTIATSTLDHVSIDRFTGGAINGALFKEQVVYGNGQEFTLKIKVNSDITDSKVLEALEKSLNDLCEGRLPLGGGTNRGNGCFTGTRN